MTVESGRGVVSCTQTPPPPHTHTHTYTDIFLSALPFLYDRKFQYFKIFLMRLLHISETILDKIQMSTNIQCQKQN